MDARKFRNALGKFPTGVVVVTARAKSGELIGMTMSSFNSVSLDPPLILFSIHRKRSALRPGSRFPATPSTSSARIRNMCPTNLRARAAINGRD